MQSLPLAPDSTYHSASPGRTVFGGRYRLERLLSRGEGDAEWLAKDKESRSWVTLRFLPTSLGLDEDAVSELTRQARVNWGLDHSSINRDLDFRWEGSLYALISEYREGFTLGRERMTRPLRVLEAADLEGWVKEVCSALDYARAQGGPPHGDLKPGALLQGKKGDRVITRWGLAAELSQRSGPEAVQASLAGSLAYSSPQLLAGEPARFSDDFYALGATLYELITGLPPFHEGDLEEQIRSEVPPTMKARRLQVGQAGDSIPSGWEAAVAACLAKDADDRPSSGEDFLAYLDGSHPCLVPAPQVPVPAPPERESAGFRQETAAVEDEESASRRGDADADTDRESEGLADGARRLSFEDAEDGGPPSSRMLLRLAFVLLFVVFGVVYYFFAWLPVRDHRQALAAAAAAEVQEQAEQERLAQEAAAAQMLRIEQEALERREAERLAEQRREAARWEAERLEAERIEAERLAAERLAAESREAERLEAERLEQLQQLPERESLAAVGEETDGSRAVAPEPVTVETPQGTARLVAETGSGQNPAVAKLSLRSLELEAEAPPVELDAENVLEADGLPVGRYRATVSREGWPTQTWDFELRANGTVERTFDLSEASVYLTSNPEGAEVWEGSRKLGETPLLLEGLAPGPVQFELRRRFHQSVTVSGVAVAGKKADLSAQLVGMEGPPGRVWERQVPGVGIPQVWIQPGSFMMGSPPDEKGRRDDESSRRVTLEKGFWIGLHEVTQDEWQAVMGGNPSLFRSGGGRLPVDTVSWSEAQEFCRRLNEQARREGRQVEGYEYRLPTEAEWEYASRAGSEGPFGGDELEAMAWYVENSGHRSREVGVRKANAWGLFDMHGNLSEWCHDWYGNYPAGAEENPSGPASGNTRVFRGGNWGAGADFCRSAKRNSARPDDRFHSLGLRVALAPAL